MSASRVAAGIAKDFPALLSKFPAVFQTWEDSPSPRTFFQLSTGSPELGHSPFSCFPFLTLHGAWDEQASRGTWKNLLICPGCALQIRVSVPTWEGKDLQWRRQPGDASAEPEKGGVHF